MTRKVTVMNYLEVVGSIAHLCNTDYKDFFEKYSLLDEECREDFVVGSVIEEIIDFEVLDDKTIEFLDLPRNQHWFICTFDNEYIENL